MHENSGKLLILAGSVILVIGLILTFAKGIPIGRLPGDIKIEKENFTFYFPLTTGIIISIILSLIFLIAGKFK